MKFFARGRIVLCWFVVVACLLSVSAEPQDGLIRGTVIDERGKAVVGANVTIKDLDIPKGTIEVQAGVVPFVETDDQGHFSFNDLKLGHRYKVYASKEQEGYPDMTMGLYNPEDKAVIAKATHQDKVVDVKIQVGPRAARVKWDVRDAVTGSSINPSVGIERIDTGDGFGGGTLAEEGFLVPADTGLIIEMSGNGFQDWYYPGFAKKEMAAPLRLGSGQEKILELQLQPK
jgi:hypothetical protein